MGEEKLFFTIGEAAQLLDVKAYVLRYWETEFKQLNPQKSETGQRVYRAKDIQICQTIKRLLYIEKYTIAGAKQQLAEMEKIGFDSIPSTPPAVQVSVPGNLSNTVVTPNESHGEGKTVANNSLPVDWVTKKGNEFRTLLTEIRKILKKHNLA